MNLSMYGAADDLLGIFEGGGVLPVQYGEMHRKKLPSEGERKLLFAVLEDAIRCYLKYRDGDPNSREHPEFLEATDWLSCEEEYGPFAFVSVCETLGINADRLRIGISKHRGRLAEIRA
jgi:hypothetical protein